MKPSTIAAIDKWAKQQQVHCISDPQYPAYAFIINGGSRDSLIENAATGKLAWEGEELEYLSGIQWLYGCTLRFKWQLNVMVMN